MKKAVIIMMVALFSGNVYAGSSCSKGTKVGMFSPTKASSGTSTSSSGTSANN